MCVSTHKPQSKYNDTKWPLLSEDKSESFNLTNINIYLTDILKLKEDINIRL